MANRGVDGLTRAELDAVEVASIVRDGKPLRARDAASLIVVDRRGSENFVLMGRRHHGHAFMPGRFVFPGGRTDPADGRIAVAADLNPAEEVRLIGEGVRATPARAKAIALSAIRETYEEAGLLIGNMASFRTRSPHWQEFVEQSVKPALDGLRYIARAITPPGRVRRYDTRFFAVWREYVAVELADTPTSELEEIAWLPIREAKALDVAAITWTVLDELERRLAMDPALSPGAPVPFYAMRGGRFKRIIL